MTSICFFKPTKQNHFNETLIYVFYFKFLKGVRDHNRRIQITGANE